MILGTLSGEAKWGDEEISNGFPSGFHNFDLGSGFGFGAGGFASFTAGAAVFCSVSGFGVDSSDGLFVSI
jgi:hypothetical protein